MSSYTYDAAGDVTYDGLNSYLYDAEGRVCAIRSYVDTVTGYIYDADGTRVAKGTLTSFSCNFASNGFTPATSWVLGPGGDQVTEYAVSGATSTWQHTNAFSGGKLQVTYHDTGIYFYLSDWLGTKHTELGQMLAANGTNQLCAAAFASLPYGDGLTPPLSLSGYATCPDATEHHFTGKERDAESGNDYFSARYYSSSMGRFLSPDWSAKVAPVPYAKLDDPQSLNLYAYVRNNPLVRFDPDGHWVCKGDSEKCKGTQTRLNLAQAAQKQLAASDNAADRKEAGRIQKVLDFYGPLSTKAGDKGDNGVNVSFGALKKNELGKAELGADGHTVNIKLDWGQLSSIGRGSSLGSGGMSLGLGAGLLIHEGTHGVDERNWGHLPLTPGQEDWTEHNAYRNESYTYQGLNFGETNLWHSGMTESERNSAIDANSKLSDAASEER